jgi:SAM-dependent methyltransferase
MPASAHDVVPAWERDRVGDDGSPPSAAARLLLSIGRRLRRSDGTGGVCPVADDAPRFREFLSYFPDLPDFRGRRVLEIGAGIGEQTACLVATGAGSVLAVEPNRLLIARLRCNVRAAVPLRADGERLPLRDDSVDIVILQDMIEHLARPAALLVEVRRVLAAGGAVLLSLMPWRAPYGGHTWSVLPLPWAHLSYPRSVLAEMRSAVAGWHTTDLGATGLYRVRVKDVDAFVRSSGLRVVHRHELGIKQQNWATRLPVVGELATAVIAYQLTK